MIAESIDGMLFGTLRVEGCPYDTQSNDDLVAHKSSWHRLIAALDPSFAVHVTLHRQRIHRHLSGAFHSSFCESFDQEYQEKCDHTFYQNWKKI